VNGNGKYQSFTPKNLPGHLATCLHSFNNNKYATRKMVTQGLVDIALLITNVSQLIAVLGVADHQPFFALLVTMLLISILLQMSHTYSVWMVMTECCVLKTV
jgi:hypothetical protein